VNLLHGGCLHRMVRSLPSPRSAMTISGTRFMPASCQPHALVPAWAFWLPVSCRSRAWFCHGVAHGICPVRVLHSATAAMLTVR
jgi:hypothetical protein